MLAVMLLACVQHYLSSLDHFFFFLIEWCGMIRAGQADCNFMDKSAPGKEACEEVTRELLIAISYTLPDNTSASKLSSEIPNGETPATKVSTDYDGAEKYRAELIAISNSESPATPEED